MTLEEKAGFGEPGLHQLSNWHILLKDLHTQIIQEDAEFIEKTEYGEIYQIAGMLTGPKGGVLSVRSIWIKEYDSKLTKFVTCFPTRSESLIKYELFKELGFAVLSS